ncbi:uncharacterized protein Z518_09331 [Rhinocladiella mackenziei CBS 650.93]|uniref:Rhinocladiella mackenziei CBS 650.93 unplaced genomic scaffold supercont1.7, whole genome shotgun sequence n=1 Tax=Rhinocladiella mackenziei CBS 650.93 TaxID=1442369 RepID=A0A0D2IYE1_9EURO|nr:uncharacterized protein Z518_09331 [Rhinocladiella mackenziei CBS 650.93]KIX01605.1 hypothetical protein Z518_09331 [Rhinocladiella mackenziei CBS 650.93]
MSIRRSLPVDEYHVGVVCALPHEMTAAIAMLDEEDEPIKSKDVHDNNSYVLGRMSQHNVVIACLPAGIYGTNAAATVAKDMLRTFTGLRFGLLVGIGGGIPNLQNGRDIRLGDVVVSQPDKTFGGVVQYDLGKNLGQGGFERKGSLNRPPTLLLTALSSLQSKSGIQNSPVLKYLAEMDQKYPSLKDEGYSSPGINMDHLHCSQCDPSHWWWFLWLLLLWFCPLLRCERCENGRVLRPSRNHENPVAHYGTIASGNQVVKDARVRDQLGQKFNALCVEMEAAGLMDNFPCVVVRGICDYADSHKNDAWQRYAAVTAAAYAKSLLRHVTPQQTTGERRIQEVVGILADQLQVNKEILNETRQQHLKTETRYQDDKHRLCHQAFKTSTYEHFKNVNPDRVDGTCQWVLSHPHYLQWCTNVHDDLLWISADPGCGKSVLTKSLVDNELQNTEGHTVCFFFFKDNEEQDSLAPALCALLHQLFTHQPQLIRHAVSAWERNGDKLSKEVPELWRMLLAAATDFEAHDVTCVLDALDECRHSDRYWLINMLAKFHSQISSSPSTARRGRLKFLVTSRPYDDIEIEFQNTLGDLPTIRLRGEEENDQIHQEINLVIRMRVGKLAKDLKLNRQTKDQLEEKLLKMEHRTYLWLYLAIESIYETYRYSFRPEEASIESLPSTVEDAYEKILRRVPEEQTGNVKKILQIVVGARRPLTVQEMAITLGIATARQTQSLDQVQLDPIRLESNIRHWCGLFVFINHGRIYLIHQTAKEFLICSSGSTATVSAWKHCLDPCGIEKDMTRILVEFLCFEDIRPNIQFLIEKLGRHKRIDDILDKENYVECLVAYSAEHWPRHLRDAHLHKNDSLLNRIWPLYDTNSGLCDLWFTIFWRATMPYIDQPRMNSVCLVACLGHEEALELMLQSNKYHDINESDNDGPIALIWASQFGHEKVMQMLLDRGAEINAQGGGYGNALQAASHGGHEKIVRILLDRGVEINAQGGFYGNALQTASHGGHEKILLDRGAEINAQGGLHGNALQAASHGGHEKVVQILLDRGAEINAQGGRYGDALQVASRNGHEKTANDT